MDKENDIIPVPEQNECNNGNVDNSINGKIEGRVKGVVGNIAKGFGAKIAEVALIVLLLVGGWIFIKTNPFNWNFTFWDTGVKIDKTANVVEQIKKISEFTTACYYEESVVKNEKKADANNVITNFFKITPDSICEEVVIIAKGKVRAGFDMAKVKAEDIVIKSDTISISLPLPEIFDVIANPSDYEVFVEEGKWSHEEIVALQVEHSDQLLQSAIDAGLLEKAKESKGKISDLFKTFGFNVVNIEIASTNK
jgi:hypothetical protein